MRYVREEMVAVSLSSPKVKTVLGPLFLVAGVKIFAKPQDDHFSQFKLQVLSWQEHLVAWHKAEHALLIFWQLLCHGNPFAGVRHRPVNWAGRLSRNA